MFTERETEAFLDGLDRPEEVATRTLLDTIVGPNVDSEWGRRHGFSSIRSPEDYARAVPIRSYEDYRADIDRIVNEGAQGILTSEPVRRFFTTSGSTAKPKYIPVTAAFTREKSRAFGIYWAMALAQHPKVTRATIVTNFSDSGSESRSPGGLPFSSESAYWGQVTAATQRRSKPIIPKLVAKTKDTEARYYALARVLLEEEFSGLMTLNPSTIYLLFQKMNEHAERLVEDVRRGGIHPDVAVSDEARALLAETYRGNPARADALAALRASSGGPLWAYQAWPSLAVVVSWRSPMLAPYLRMLEPHLVGVAGRDYISMASEGIIAIPTRAGASGGVVAAGVHYYEFVPEELIETPNPPALLPHQLEVGKSYVTILSTQSGLYRYNIGDVVRVAGFEKRTPIIEFLHRAGNTCSLTGEKLTEDQVTEAVAAAAREAGVELTSFTAAPADQGFPRYVLLVEPTQPASRAQLARLRDAFERELDRRNIEYGSKRESKRLGGPEVWQVQAGEYAARRQRRVQSGTNDAQFKPTHLTRDSRILRELTVTERVEWEG